MKCADSKVADGQDFLVRFGKPSCCDSRFRSIVDRCDSFMRNSDTMIQILNSVVSNNVYSPYHLCPCTGLNGLGPGLFPFYFSSVSDSFRRFPTVSDDFRRFPTVSDGSRRFPTISDGFRLSVDCRSTVGRQSVDCRSTVGRLSVDCVGRQSVDGRSIVGRLPVDWRSTVGRLCRSMYLIHGSDPCIWSMARVHGSDPEDQWLRSVDRMHG